MEENSSIICSIAWAFEKSEKKNWKRKWKDIHKKFVFQIDMADSWKFSDIVIT